MPDDFYALLEVDADASEAAIRRAYRSKARDHHPDVSDDADASEQFRRLKRARAVLTDPEERRAYDRLGHDRYLSSRSHGDDTLERSDGRGSDSATTSSPGPRAARPRDPFPRFNEKFSTFAGGWATGKPPATTFASSGECDLRSFFRGTRSSGVTDRTADSDGGAGSDCPKCGGRGTIVHVLDTGRGRRRRTERCERCAGTGAV